MRRAVSAYRDTLATKADLAGVRDELWAELAVLEARSTWRLVGIAVAIVAAMKLIPGLDRPPRARTGGTRPPPTFVAWLRAAAVRMGDAARQAAGA